MTSVVNTTSVAFHNSIGFSVDGYKPHPDVDGGQYVQMSRPVRPAESPVVELKGWPPDEHANLVGEYVTVRPTVAGDSTALFTALDDERVWQHLTLPRPTRPTEMREQVHAAIGERYPWTVRLSRAYRGLNKGDVVGWSSFLELSTQDARVEIGSTAYAPDVWRSAVNTETKLLLLGHAFDVLGFGRVQLKTDIRNVQSQRGIEGVGGQREGVLRWYQRRADGTLRNTVVYSITRAEWPAVRDRLRSRLAVN